MTVLSTIACVVSPEGIYRPPYSDIYETLQASFQSIYGSDAYIAPDSKDGQLLAVVAKAVDDSNAATVAVYNGFSPATAVGNALSSNVKINGLRRNVPTRSTVVVRLTGTVGTVIPADSIMSDVAGARWTLVTDVTIPAAGFIDQTVVAEEFGAVSAPIGTITRIETPQRGWQSVSNTTPATLGAPVETDAALRQRQAGSVALPSLTIMDGISAAIMALDGVLEVRGYENNTNATDANGLPAHSISMVVRGGINTAIATAIARKKTPGIATYGNQTVTVTDTNAANMNIQYTIPTVKQILVAITITSRPGYQVAYVDQIKAQVMAYINALGSGKRVDLGRIYVPAQLYFGPGSSTFEVETIQLGAVGGPALAAQDISIAIGEVANLDLANITVTVL
jgi:uncharacterized phage protein gp47/JayE